MFFKKIRNQVPAIQPQKNKQRAPLYIIGSGALACFLAAKFQDAGENVVIVSSSAGLQRLKDDLTIKEEYNLQKKTCRFDTASVVGKAPLAVILASDSHTLQAHLTFLPGKSLGETPLICFNDVGNKKIIRPLLGKNFYPAYFYGCLELNGNTLTAFNLQPEITISKTPNEEQTDIVDELLSETGLSVSYSPDDKTNFWKHFSVNALGFLFSARGQNLSSILKDKNNKETIHAAVAELSKLALSDQSRISADEISGRLYGLPGGCVFKSPSLTPSAEISILDAIFETISLNSRRHDCKTDTLNRLLKNGYQTLLKK